jgi:iron(III) transport system permease protein
MTTSTLRHRVVSQWYFWLPAGVVSLGVLVPLAYLVIRAFEADPALLRDLVFRWRNLQLLWNTLLLAGGVLAFASVLAFPLAFLTTRTDLRFRGGITLLGVLPLAVPGYVMAYVLLATTGGYGTLALVLGIEIPRLSGYTGAVIALGIYTFPYLFLNLRAALSGLDPSLEECAQSLGLRRRRVFIEVILPQLRPAFLAGALLVGLHVLGDFGVVSLMRYETFSYALYLQYSAAYDRIYAAWLALMLLVLTGSFLWLEARLLRGRLFHRTGTGASRKASPLELGWWRYPAYAFAGLVGLFSVILPLFTVGHWMVQSGGGAAWASLGRALANSVSASGPAAVMAGILALPLCYLSVRRPSKMSHLLERISYLGYATPPLAFALALIFFSLQAFPMLYQTLVLLIIAYSLHFMAEAMGPLRSSLYQAPPRLEEAARILGRSPLRAFMEATFPLLRRGLLVSMAFVFLSAMKELPITFLLSPIGFETLALGVWSAATEARFGQAAPYALTIMLFSAGFVGLLLIRERRFG